MRCSSSINLYCSLFQYFIGFPFPVGSESFTFFPSDTKDNKFGQIKYQMNGSIY